MSDGINKVILIGNLGENPTLRETRAGKSVCNFRLATNTTHGKGEYSRELLVWHSIVVWGRLAENCVEHLRASSRVYIEGHLRTKKWEDRNGNERINTEVIVDKMIFLDRKELEE